MLAYWGDRRLSVCRELTKLHEETLRFTLSEAVAYFTGTPPRGEFVLVIEGAPEEDEPHMSLDRALELVRSYTENGFSLRDAVKKCALETGFSKNTLYDAAIRTK